MYLPWCETFHELDRDKTNCWWFSRNERCDDRRRAIRMQLRRRCRRMCFDNYRHYCECRLRESQTRNYPWIVLLETCIDSGLYLFATKTIIIEDDRSVALRVYPYRWPTTCRTSPPVIISLSVVNILLNYVFLIKMHNHWSVKKLFYQREIFTLQSNN